MNFELNIVSVPKAPVHENARPVLPQHQIRMPRQPLVIQPISEPSFPQPTPHHHLRLRILRPNRRHIGVPLLGSDFVHDAKIGLFHIYSKTKVRLSIVVWTIDKSIRKNLVTTNGVIFYKITFKNIKPTCSANFSFKTTPYSKISLLHISMF